jgi:hypothetical protein
MDPHPDGHRHAVKPITALGVSVLVAAPVSFLACGGTGSPAQPSAPGTTTSSPDAQADVTVDEGTAAEAGADAVIVDSSEAAADAVVPDGQCPATLPPDCQAGQTCMFECNLCFCLPDAGGGWGCTAKFCPAPGDP